MCQQLYLYLKRDESAAKRLFITPIEVTAGVSSGAELI